jgi:NAD(P)-dependent dehydrogenase (short-subunit alcohol dehydrogenase family)
MRPLWIPFDVATEGAAELQTRVRDAVADYRRAYTDYYTRQSAEHTPPDGGDGGIAASDDPTPRIVLIQGIGLVGIGRNATLASLSRDLYQRSIAVMGGASALGEYVSLTEAESFAVEYWPLERYKLTLAPPPKELGGKVALITGGAGGIGAAICRALAADGACIVAADLDAQGAETAVAAFGNEGLGVAADVTDEDAVTAAYRRAVLSFGGVDIVVSNAGLASSAPIEDTSVAMWDRNHAVLVKGYFLVSRAAFRLWKLQGIGGNLVFVVSKNAVAAGKNAAAYSSAKAAELHLARCLAEEGGTNGIRVNVVNPDAVLQGSRIWDSSWRNERAHAYGIAPDQLENFYRDRTTLKVNVLPEDIAEAVRFFASRRSSKTTGNMLNVDGGVAIAYPR